MLLPYAATKAATAIAGIILSGNTFTMPSTVIAHMDYSEASKQLRIVFVSGLVYVYKKVPLALYEQMKAAFSKGVFFNQHIKGKFEFEQVK